MLVDDYNPEWIIWFVTLREFLAKQLGDSYIAIEHIGSTSVPGMVTKPIIDIDIVIRVGAFADIRRELCAIGYRHEGDLGISGREAFDLRTAKMKSSLPAHHLYVCQSDCAELQRHIAFRNYLRRHEAIVVDLSFLKILLVSKHDNDLQAYICGKSEMVRQITENALVEDEGGGEQQKVGECLNCNNVIYR